MNSIPRFDRGICAVVLILFWSFGLQRSAAQTGPPSQAEADGKAGPGPVAREFWVIWNLGDLEELKRLVRPVDVASIPQPQGTGAEIMKLKSLEQLKPLREEIKAAVNEAFSLGPPEMDADGIHAMVRVTASADHLVAYCELKMVYDGCMVQAYRDARDGRAPPSVEFLKEKFLVRESPYMKRVEEMAAGFRKKKIPPLNLELTDQGWRVNLLKFLGLDRLREKQTDPAPPVNVR